MSAPEPGMPTEEQDEAEAFRAAARRQVRRVRRLKLHAAAWGLGTFLLTTLWALRMHFDRRPAEAKPGGKTGRLRLHV